MIPAKATLAHWSGQPADPFFNCNVRFSPNVLVRCLVFLNVYEVTRLAAEVMLLLGQAQVTYSVPRGNSPDAAGHFGEPQLVIGAVPQEWRKHAREPWRILFSDLEWAPSSRDE